MADFSRKSILPNSQSSSGEKLWLLLALCIANVGIGFAVVSMPAQNILFIMMLLLLTIIPIHRYMESRDPFDALIIISIGFIFYFVIGGLSLQIMGLDRGRFDLALVYLGVILGYVAFLIGYFLRLDTQSKTEQNARGVSKDKLLQVASIMFIISAFAALLLELVPESFSPTASGLLQNVGHLSKLATLLFLAHYTIEPSRRSLALLIVSLVVAFSFELFLFEIERRTVLRWMITLTVYWHYRRQNFKLRTLIVLGVGALMLIFGFKIIAGFYSFPRETWSVELFQTIVERRINRFDDAFVAVATTYEGPVAVENFGLIIEGIRTGQLDWLWGSSYFRVLLAFIPREIWPEKPLQLGRQIPDLIESSFTSGALPITNLGEMYFNLGYIGIFVTMFLLGVFCRFLYRLLAESRREGELPAIPQTLIYAVSIGFILQYFRGGIHGIILGYLFFNLVPLMVGMKYFTNRSMQGQDKAAQQIHDPRASEGANQAP